MPQERAFKQEYQGRLTREYQAELAENILHFQRVILLLERDDLNTLRSTLQTHLNTIISTLNDLINEFNTYIGGGSASTVATLSTVTISADSRTADQLYDAADVLE